MTESMDYLDDDYYDDQNPPPATEKDIRPEDIPAGANPVCRRCGQLAEWDGQGWRHAEILDLIVCNMLFGRSDA